MSTPDADAVAVAAERLAGLVVRTPLVEAEPMAARTGSRVVIKAEHRQATGSFKLRGATNIVQALASDELATGVITASSGNHGIGTATAAARRDVPCTVYLPRGAARPKRDAIARLGATVVTVDDPDAAAAEREARAEAERRGRRYVSPYNDPLIVAGQGTIGVELVEDWSGAPPDAVVVAVGGGGLISGIGTWLQANWPDTDLIGASPANDDAMAASVAAGSIIEVEATPTFSDGTAGAVEPGAMTFELCRRLVDRWESATEVEIATAVRSMVDDHHELVEGSAGVALAVAERFAGDHPGSTVAVVSCGANVASSRLAEMLAVAGPSS
ncbi:MAG: pyridoxal-phosphate dependent enzyme [Actinomycetota bacterium]